MTYLAHKDNFSWVTNCSLRKKFLKIKPVWLCENAWLPWQPVMRFVYLQNQSYLKPLSHQGGVLTVIPRRPKKNAERRGARSTNACITAATQWHRHRTRWDRIERRAMARTLSILKTNTVTRRSLGVLIERRGDTVRSP